MHYTMLEKAIFIITKYQIFEFPVQKHYIEKLLEDKNIKIIILNNFKSTCLLNNEILTHKKHSAMHLLHEMCHFLFHSGTAFNRDFIINTKNENQAKAFTAYFLMPVYIFEEAMKYCSNNFELSEEFGVTIEFVAYRKTLTAALIHDGYFDEELFKEEQLYA